MAHGGVPMPPARTRRVRASRVERRQLTVKIEPFGPKPADIEALAQRLTRHPAVQAELGKTRYRLLHIDLLEAEPDVKLDKPKPPERFRATFVDYTRNRTVFATGSLARQTSLELRE